MNHHSPDTQATKLARHLLAYDESAPRTLTGLFRGTLSQHMGLGDASSRLESLKSTHCAVLLGLPGIGVSSALKALDVLYPREKTIYLSASDYPDVSAFWDYVETHTAWRSWREDNGNIHVFLDNLGRGRVPIARWMDGLLERLSNLSLEGLSLRLGARVGAWTTAFSEQLETVWGDTKDTDAPPRVRVAVLAPLSFEEVIGVCEARKVPGETFANGLHRAGVLDLAGSPRMLETMLSTWRSSKGIPDRMYVVTKIILRALNDAVESDEGKDNVPNKESLQKLIAVAARLGAGCALTDHEAIDLDGNEDGLVLKDLTADPLERGSVEFRVRPGDVLTCIEHSGLLAAIDSSQRTYQWLHPSLANWGAVVFSQNHHLSTAQLLDLINHPHPGIAPRFEDVAGWLADAHLLLRETLIKTAPRVMLRANVHYWPARDRDALVESLLQATSSERLVDNFGHETHYSKLNHPSIAKQLRPVISNASKSFACRRIAINIAGQCHCESLEVDLFNLALDRGEEPTLRADALRSLLAFDRLKLDDRLISMTCLDYREDPDDALLGLALEILWKHENIELNAMLSALRTPHHKSLIGVYRVLLGRLPKLIWSRWKAQGLRRLIEWCREHYVFYDHYAVGNRLAEDTLDFVIKNIVSPEVVSALAAWAVEENRVWDNLIHQTVSRSPEHFKRLFGDQLIALDKGDSTKLNRILRMLPVAANEKTLSWLIHQYQKTKGDPKHDQIAVALVQTGTQMVWPDNEDVLSLYWSDPEDNQTLRSLVMTDQRQTAHSRPYQPPPLSLDDNKDTSRKKILVGLQKLVEELKGQETPEWPFVLKFLYCLTCRVQRSLESLVFEVSAADLPRPNIVDGLELFAPLAWRFLAETPTSDEWLAEQPRLSPEAMIGLRTWEWLSLYQPESLQHLPEGVYERWLPVMFGYFWEVRRGRSQAQQVREAVLLRVANRRHKEILGHGESFFIKGLDRALETFLERASSAQIPNLVQWACNLLDNYAQEEPIQRVTLQWLTKNGSLEEVLQRMSWAVDSLLRSSIPRKFGEAVLQWLLSDQGNFSEIWKTLQNMPLQRQEADEYITLLFVKVIDSNRLNTKGLDSTFLCWLLELLIRLRPEPTEGQRRGSVDDHLRYGFAQSAVNSELISRGSWQVVAELECLAERLPSAGWVRWIIDRARRQALEATWSPPTFEQLLKLAQDRRHRLIRDRQQLLGVVHEEVRRWRQRLSREPLRALWERIPDDRWRPCTQGLATAMIERHLREHLTQIVVNGEVEISTLQNALKVKVRSWKSDPQWSKGPELIANVFANHTDDVLERLQGHWEGMPTSVARLAIVLCYGEDAWTSSDAYAEQRRLARQQSPEHLNRVLPELLSPMAMRALSCGWICLDLSFNETREDLRDQLPYGDRLLSAMEAESAEVLSCHSIGDQRRWLVELRSPPSLVEQYRVAPSMLLCAQKGPIDRHLLYHARRELHQRQTDLEQDIVLVASVDPVTLKQVELIPGGSPRWIAWSLAQESIPSLAISLEQRLAMIDVFDRRDPVRGRQVYGREAPLADLIEASLKGNWSFIVGLRRVGKTTLAKALCDQLDPIGNEEGVRSAWAVMIDAQDMGTSTLDGVRTTIVEALRERLELAGLPIPDHISDAETVVEWALLQGPRRMHLVIDEHELLFETSSGNKVIEGIAGFFRRLKSISSRTRCLSVTFIGRDPRHLEAANLEEVDNPLKGLCREVWLGGMSQRSMDKMLRGLARKIGFSFDAEALSHIWAWTGGHPSLARLFGSAYLSLARERGTRNTETLSLAEALERVSLMSYPHTILTEIIATLELRHPGVMVLLQMLSQGEAPPTLTQNKWFHVNARTLRRYKLLSGEPKAPRLPEMLRWHVRQNHPMAHQTQNQRAS